MTKTCTHPRCSFTPDDDCGELDDEHIYCLHCRGMVHLGCRDPVKLSGNCPDCGGIMIDFRKTEKTVYYRLGRDGKIDYNTLIDF